MTCRVYCAVYGCMNSSISHAELTFFKLPGNSERRLQWLQLIHRDDLENKPKFTSYRVCEKHFNLEDVLQSSNRKLLKKNALPLLMLPNLANTDPGDARKEDKQTQTDLLIGNEHCTHTKTKAICTQTPTSLLSNTPRERKLKAELLQFRKKIKLHKTKKAEENTFHQLCDKFLSDKLALLIKAQSKLKQHGKGNRYNKNYIIYCLKLYSISPQAYRFLQSALCLPCPATLYKLAKSTQLQLKSMKTTTGTK